MKGALIGVPFMLPSYGFIVAAILSKEDMNMFFTFMALSFAATVGGLCIGYHWINKRFSA